MNARAFVLALAGLAPLGSFATEPPVASVPPAFHELMTLLAARRHGHVSFTEVHEMAMLKAPLTSSGELVYDAPARLEKRTLAPKAETLAVGVLASSRLPMLADLGAAVAPGAFLALLFSAMLSKPGAAEAAP
jgi:hypothetical protein